ncbi:Tubulin tyrosine ligase-like protein 4 [Minicystis rosea]|nr:Tubulin tyrosine ligase-like protein 4 [Minicystis rosea]
MRGGRERGVMSVLSMLPKERYWSRSPRFNLVRTLDRHGWTRVSRPADADVLVVGSHRHLEGLDPREDQLVDVVAGTEHMTHKGRLATLLRAHGLAAALQPETFLVDDDPAEIERLRERARIEPDAVWIRKPVARGRGIGVEPLVDVEGWLASRAGPGAEGAELVQRYITNPLLVEGTKSEIRSYVLIASTNPLLVLYHDGTVRLTSLPFVRGDWSNPLVHVTNTYRQKRADPERWATAGAGMKWTLDALGRDVHARGLTDDSGWVESTLRPALIAMIRAVVRAALPQLSRRRGAFQLLGMDTMVTDDLEELWLTEMQLGPGLSTEGPVKATLIPEMLAEAAALVIEARDRIQRGEDPRALRARRGFHWVYAETDPEVPGDTID